MSHTELLLGVNIHWLFVIHSYDVRTIETFTHNIIFSPGNKNTFYNFEDNS